MKTSMKLSFPENKGFKAQKSTKPRFCAREGWQEGLGAAAGQRKEASRRRKSAAGHQNEESRRRKRAAGHQKEASGRRKRAANHQKEASGRANAHKIVYF